MSLYTEKDFHRLKPIESNKGDLPQDASRTDVRRDYARILHSPAFRRLQGKTQLFPGDETDFFRNRLTHSLEVAQIAKDIAIKINHDVEFFKMGENSINPDICEIAGLIHDLGHPPFGHNGEKALDDCMKSTGGFEGNAQTLHILLRTEKKEMGPGANYATGYEKAVDKRLGLNLTHRVVASALKYDQIIPYCRKKTDKLVKGYYSIDSEMIDTIKSNIRQNVSSDKPFKTIECQIMDIADDIAYSTYDIEDALKAEFITPFDIISCGSGITGQIAKKINETEGRDFITSDEVKRRLLEIFGSTLAPITEPFGEYKGGDDPSATLKLYELLEKVTSSYEASKWFSQNGYIRTSSTSFLVHWFILGVKVDINEEDPTQSKVYLDEETKKNVEVLKHYCFINLINSPKLKISEFRGYDIIRSIFAVLTNSDEEGHKLLPADFQKIYEILPTNTAKNRLVCDFIAGMTDRYAIEFYGRLNSENPQSIFKPF
ncbi:dNTP triphosphohydrolase [Sphaerochaeta halotolerans]|uniref:DNTP triphosphohydrolase n=1 Tax=Sphaerochaeta halotolerans TaxID=2293840 RepID=A0A372MD85_9SPIR|nr:dNTP triphosphohydrolase [Sphaerochaeta halotolerans]RFU93724.1 dNTP triphosphohydrolase [Sphaerochaeta halotolerans]